ncbi:hypothetical protein C7S20_02440 [Christiangramia fulva]|uniref:Uncharacterized protein n=1 Tax=Christiangramia fulva TaxID=2126553 RepID=A0A2R3Z1R9_9FLAO|nr:hypothetical protein C7S20_02440 [Christiangramia fulva]
MMKKIAVIFLFFAFTARPVYEFAYLTYFKLNQSEIIRNFCVNKNKPELHCNGKCHLMKELSLGSKSDKKQNTILAESFLPLFFQEYSYKSRLYISDFYRCDNWRFLPKDYSQIQTVPSPPPKV